MIDTDASADIEYIRKINILKNEKSAVILAHHYMSRLIKFGIADNVGDSLELAKVSQSAGSSLIVLCGVRFMAETAKILSPAKKILLPSQEAGCSLAESITPEDIQGLRGLYPDAPVVAYINTSASVKAESDMCVTSSNAVRIISGMPERKILFVPDEYMGKNIARELPEKEIITWNGRCIVHETFNAEEIERYRKSFVDIKVIAHYECSPEVLSLADMHGSTSQMISYIKSTDAPHYLLLTECDLATTIHRTNPEKNILGPCAFCKYMKKIDLKSVYEALLEEKNEILLSEDIMKRARVPLEKMMQSG